MKDRGSEKKTNAVKREKKKNITINFQQMEKKVVQGLGVPRKKGLEKRETTQRIDGIQSVLLAGQKEEKMIYGKTIEKSKEICGGRGGPWKGD